MSNEYLKPEEIAKQYRVTRQAIYKWIAEGKLRAVKLGKVTRISREALDDFIRQTGDAPNSSEHKE